MDALTLITVAAHQPHRHVVVGYPSDSVGEVTIHARCAANWMDNLRHPDSIAMFLSWCTLLPEKKRPWWALLFTPTGPVCGQCRKPLWTR